MPGLAILMMATLLLMAPGYGQAQQSGGKSAPAAAGSSASKERQAYQEKAREQLAILQQQIEDLHGSYQTAPPQKKRTVLRVLHSLDQQLLAARNQFAALEKASDQEWRNLSIEMNNTLKDLAKAYSEAQAMLQ